MIHNNDDHNRDAAVDRSTRLNFCLAVWGPNWTEVEPLRHNQRPRVQILTLGHFLSDRRHTAFRVDYESIIVEQTHPGANTKNKVQRKI